MKATSLFAILGIASLSACSGTGTSDMDPAPDMGLNPTYSSLGAASIASDASIARGLRESDPYIIQPFGSSAYVGNLTSSNVSVDGAGGYGLVGDARINVSFGGGSNSVTGTISNINLLENGTPTELLQGSLNVAGAIDTRQDFDTTAAGALTGVWGGDTTGTVNLALNMDGSTRIVPGSTIFGNRNLGAIVAPNVNGSGSGAHSVVVSGGTMFGYEE